MISKRISLRSFLLNRMCLTIRPMLKRLHRDPTTMMNKTSSSRSSGARKTKSTIIIMASTQNPQSQIMKHESNDLYSHQMVKDD